jgi:uncharacterized membrane protein YsdA (DUF1294 family)/cold shock CspA family protein
MRCEGILKTWSDEQGHGFIAPMQGGAEVFLHVDAFKHYAGRPRVGLPVSYEVETGPQGTQHAKNATPLHTTRVQRDYRAAKPARWSALAMAAIPLWVALFLAMSWGWGVSHRVALAYFAMSLLAFLAYALDKTAAVRRGPRVSERLLLTLGLLGGWPGALLAQKLLRHKTSKVSFRNAFVFTVVLNIIGFVCLSSPVVRHLMGK